ncbi:TetR/AcrR family transcriptional regulator [Microbacterium soli]|uniref:TetR/AcrR family transcriptional regulator n=1 Tax=Microbacterium soli TaxID=446075 RepID=A0ABP7ND26_9MICO
MTDSADAAPRRRRRGAALEAALLDAAWDELVATGFARLTMESIAARANTGVAVLYRRWANKDELVLAALERYRSTHTFELPDNGTLRDDLIDALTGMSASGSTFFAIAAATMFTGLITTGGLTPAQVRDRVFGEQRLARVRTIYQRAHDRGELDLARVPSAVLAMPFDLVRHDLLMDLKPLPPERIRSIVDDLFLPLIAAH